MNDTWWIKEEDLDDDQKDFAGLGPTENHLITGPPGCGKTNLLLLRAKYMYRAGQTNILVIVFTKTLQEFIDHGSNAYGLPEGVVLTLRKWQKDFLREHGVKIKVTGTFDEQREQMASEIVKLVTSKKLHNLYQIIERGKLPSLVLEHVLGTFAPFIGCSWNTLTDSDRIEVNLVALGSRVVGILPNASGDPLIQLELLIIQIPESDRIQTDGLSGL